MIERIDAYERRAQTTLSVAVGPCVTDATPGSRGVGCHAVGCSGLVATIEEPCVFGREHPCGLTSWRRDGATLGGVGSLACDVGRGGSGPSAATRGHRSTLIADLDSALRASPGDDWIRGQLVAYLIADHQENRAVAVTSSCMTTRPACLRLNAYAVARSGNIPKADSLFAGYLTSVGAEGSCSMRSIQALLPAPIRSAYANLACDDPRRAALEDRLWWLGQPAWLSGSNDRRVEHFARAVERDLTTDWLATVCHSALACPNGAAEIAIADSDAIVARGMPDSWWGLRTTTQYKAGTVVRTPGKGTSEIMPSQCLGAWSDNSRARYHFLPNANSLFDPGSIDNDSWEYSKGENLAAHSVAEVRGIARILDRGTGSCVPPERPERFTPAYAATVARLDQVQIAFFDRDDSARVVIAANASQMLLGPRFSDVRWRVGTFAFSHLDDRLLPRDSASDVREISPRETVRVTLAARWGLSVIGMEILSPKSLDSAGALARFRGAYRPTDLPSQRIRLSELLFIDSARTPVDHLEGPAGAAARALGGLIFRARQDVGIFWEVYGTRASDSASYTLTVTPLEMHRSWLSNAARSLIRATDRPVSIKWTTIVHPGVDGIFGESLNIGLSHLPPGRYRANLTASFKDQAPVTVGREFSIAAGNAPHASSRPLDR